MPVIRLSDATFVDLKTLSTWMGEDTPSKTINILVQDKMLALDLVREKEFSEDKIQLNDDEASGLSFTRVLAASVDGQSVDTTWNNILIQVIKVIKQSGVTGKDLIGELRVRTKLKQFSEQGYKFYPEIEISVQGQSAADAWRETSRLAKKWGIEVWVDFVWKDDAKARHPGEHGLVRVLKAKP